MLKMAIFHLLSDCQFSDCQLYQCQLRRQLEVPVI